MKKIPNLDHYALFADVFRYPETRLEPYTENLLNAVVKIFPDKSQEILAVFKLQTGMSIGEQQEYYLKTFDVQAVCSLDIGYLLFGEDYKRAQLLVNLQKEHQRAKVDCGGELADHLPNILALLTKAAGKDFAEELGFIILIPAIKFMLVKMKHVNNYYKIFLNVLLYFLEADFKGENMEEYAIPDQLLQESNEFLFPAPKNIICEMGCKQKSF